MERESLPLRRGHGWKAPAGMKIFVAGVTVLRIPPAELSAAELLAGALDLGAFDAIRVDPVVRADRPGLSLAWREVLHRDRSGREAVSRTCMACRGGICVLLTFDFWSDDRERVSWVWDEALGSMELGRYVRDPTVGDVDQN